MEELLQDQIYYFSTYFDINAIGFISHLFQVFYGYKIEENIFVGTLSNNL